MRAMGIAVALCISLLTVAAVIAASPASGQSAAEIDALHAQAAQLFEARKYGEALLVAQQALALGEQQFGADDERLAKLYYGVALLHDRQDHPVEAESFYQRALAILEKVRGGDQASVGKVLDALARLRMQQKRYSEAEPLYQRRLAILETTLGPEHPDVATTLNNLAIVYRVTGRRDEATSAYERLLTIQEKALGPEHLDVAATLYWLALLGNSGRTETLYLRALAIREKALGANHADVESTLDRLATFYWTRGQLAEAESYFSRSIAIKEMALGPEPLKVAAALAELAARSESQGYIRKAEFLYKRVLALREHTLEADHLEVGAALESLARLYQQQARHAEALPLFKRSFAIRDKLRPGAQADEVAVAIEVERLLRPGKQAEAIALAEWVLEMQERAPVPRRPAVVQSLVKAVELFLGQGIFAEIESLAERSLALSEQALGSEHPDVVTALDNLARIYEVQHRYGDAEALRKRMVAVCEKALGPDHLEVSRALNFLAGLYESQSRYDEAIAVYSRVLAIREKVQGSEHPDVGRLLNRLAQLYRDQGRTSEAELLGQRGLSIRQRAADFKAEMVRLRDAGRYAEATELAQRLLALEESGVQGKDRNDVAVALNDLAQLYWAQDRYGEAEPLLRRSLDILEKTWGAEGSNVAVALNSLANLYADQGRYADAEPLFRRSLAISDKNPDDGGVSNTLNSLAKLERAQGRYAEAEVLYKRSLALRETVFGPEHREVAAALSNLAGLYEEQGRYGEAEVLYKRSIGILQQRLEPDHPDLGIVLHNLGGNYRDQGRYADAEPLLQRSLTIFETALGPFHLDVGTALNNLADLAYLHSDWAGAADYWRRSANIIKHRAERGLAGSSRGEATLEGEARRLTTPFLGLVRASYRLARLGDRAEALASEMFEVAQWVQGSQAAASLAQMAARSAKGSPELAKFVRERQDLLAEWQAKDKLLIAAQGEPAEKRNEDAERTLRERLAVIDTRLIGLDRRLKIEFPDYAAFANQAPLSVEEVQALLGAEEALVLFLDLPKGKSENGPSEETFVWVVSKLAVRWLRSDLGTAALAREVGALRCGLDATAWDAAGGARCAELLNMALPGVPNAGEPLPFDHARAYKLYAALFGEVGDLTRGKHLLIVPSGALSQLPFQVLLTKPPASGDHRSAAWLAREHALSVLPAVSSLKALRRVGKPSAAPRAMIGFGNPLLEGGDAELAKLAVAKQRCSEVRKSPLVARVGSHATVASVERRGSLVDVTHIRQQVPLPETADELCAVARDMKANSSDIRLGKRATEAEVKRLSASGDLALYRTVHFATHGVLAGDLDGSREPGLILTPPAQATEEDDGYLSASEIAGLKLDADWVILSACNTAAGAAANAEAFSGLARAFIYAQARALLVSHWAVYSDATVKLITGAIREMAHSSKVGRAEALRRSMLALIDKGAPFEAHPAHWAPFVLVGEGASLATSAVAQPQAARKASKSAASARSKQADDWQDRAFDSR